MARNDGLTAKQREAANYVREEDLEDLGKFLNELKSRVEQARGDGRTFMMAQYVRLVALVSPEVTRLRKRLEREDLAGFRKAHKMLRAGATDQDESE